MERLVDIPRNASAVTYHRPLTALEKQQGFACLPTLLPPEEWADTDWESMPAKERLRRRWTPNGKLPVRTGPSRKIKVKPLDRYSPVIRPTGTGPLRCDVTYVADSILEAVLRASWGLLDGERKREIYVLAALRYNLMPRHSPDRDTSQIYLETPPAMHLYRHPWTGIPFGLRLWILACAACEMDWGRAYLAARPPPFKSSESLARAMRAVRKLCWDLAHDV